MYYMRGGRLAMMLLEIAGSNEYRVICEGNCFLGLW